MAPARKTDQPAPSPPSATTPDGSGTSRRPGCRNCGRCASEIDSAPGGEGQDAARRLMAEGPALLHQADGDANWLTWRLGNYEVSGELVCEKLRERWYRGNPAPRRG